MKLGRVKCAAVSALLFILSAQHLEAESPPARTTYNLDACYTLARGRMESLQISAEGIASAEARYRQAVSELYPHLDLVASEQLQHNSGISTSGRSAQPSRFRAGLRVTQPIFSGFRDFLIASAADAELKALKLDHERLKELLYKDVAEVFFELKFYEEDLRELNRSAEVLRQRTQELGEFVKLGKAKESELLTAKSDLVGAEASITESLGLQAASKELLAYMLGVPADEIRLGSGGEAFLREPLDNYLARVASRTDLEASASRVESQENQLTAAERKRWPTIQLEGDYSPVDSPKAQSSASLLVSLEMPIFDAGLISAQVAEQQASLQSEKLRAQQLRRESERDIRSSYQSLLSAEQEVKKLEELVSVATKTYDAEKRDYSLGVVNNLDVLQAIRSLQDAKRRLARAHYDLKTSQIQVAVAAGGLAK